VAAQTGRTEEIVCAQAKAVLAAPKTKIDINFEDKLNGDLRNGHVSLHTWRLFPLCAGGGTTRGVLYAYEA
jgi:hypothetical protein